jgi:hypothetical protein
MYKISQKQLVVGMFLFFAVLVACNSISAQPTVQLLLEPDIRTIVLGGNVAEIAIIARTDTPNVQFAWNLSGPGVLTGDLTGPGVLYLPPNNHAEIQTHAMITVTVADEERREHKENVVFTLIKPEPTPTPQALPSPTAQFTPILTPVPTDTPVPTRTPNCPALPKELEKLQQLLHNDLNHYQELRVQERKGQQANRQIIETNTTIICDLMAIEEMLAEAYKMAPNDEILQRIQRTKAIRESYEQELFKRGK